VEEGIVYSELYLLVYHAMDKQVLELCEILKLLGGHSVIPVNLF
jgi:hypothetical protein